MTGAVLILGAFGPLCFDPHPRGADALSIRGGEELRAVAFGEAPASRTMALASLSSNGPAVAAAVSVPSFTQPKSSFSSTCEGA